MDRMELKTSLGFKIRLAIVALFSLGLGLLSHLIRSRSWPRLIDREGITLRNGTRYAWSNLSRVGVLIVVDRRGMTLPFGGAWQLTFGEVTITLNPSTFRKGNEALELITALTGRSPKTG